MKIIGVQCGCREVSGGPLGLGLGSGRCLSTPGGSLFYLQSDTRCGISGTNGTRGQTVSVSAARSLCPNSRSLDIVSAPWRSVLLPVMYDNDNLSSHLINMCTFFLHLLQYFKLIYIIKKKKVQFFCDTVGILR